VANDILTNCLRDTAAKILIGGAGIYGLTQEDFAKADKAAGLKISVEAKPAPVAVA
jgi:hypothetical protein